MSGEVPEGWELLSVKDAVRSVSVPADKKLQTLEYEDDGLLPIIDQGAKDICGFTSDVSRKIDTDLPVTVFGDHTRHLKFVDFEFAVGADGVKILRPRAPMDDRYFFYALSNIDLPSEGYSRHFRYLKERSLFRAPLPEQQKIAEILTSVDDAIQATEVVIEQTKKVRQGVMSRLLTKGIGHTRFKQTEIGEIPEGWEAMPIGDLLESSQYGINQSLSSEPPGVPVLRMGNIQDFRLDLGDLKYAELAAETAGRYLVRRNDILFNRTNSLDLVGKVAIVDTDNELSFSSYIVRLRAAPSVADPGWLFCSLASARQQNRLRALATPGVSQANINPTKMREMLLPVPPVKEQEEIAATSLVFDATLAADRTRVRALAAVKRALMSDLLTGRKRVAV